MYYNNNIQKVLKTPFTCPSSNRYLSVSVSRGHRGRTPDVPYHQVTISRSGDVYLYLTNITIWNVINVMTSLSYNGLLDLLWRCLDDVNINCLFICVFVCLFVLKCGYLYIALLHSLIIPIIPIVVVLFIIIIIIYYYYYYY